MSVNYDIGHATVEGGQGGWRNSFRLTVPYLKGIAIRNVKRGTWEPQWFGEGMVNFKEYFAMVKHAGFSGPVQMHFEYPLGGVRDGAAKLAIPQEDALRSMRQDLQRLRGWFAEASL